MRVRLHFKIPMTLPLSYRLIILSYLKESIRSQSEGFYNSFFIKGKDKTKPYAFATYFQNLKIKNDAVQADSMNVTISSSSSEFMIYLINGCQQIREFSYKDIKLTLTRVELLREKTINQPQVWLKTLSPILIESKGGKPVLFNQPDFEKEFNFIVSTRIKEIEGRPLYEPLKILKHSLQKAVIKENFHQKQGKELYFTANQGIFLIEGDPEDLKFLYLNGIGLRTGVGFGAVQIL